MRKFVVSDLHGQGNIYRAIIKYLESLKEEYKLYVNGDVIDRGPETFEILSDMIKRDNVELLAGNHELMMLDFLEVGDISRKSHSWTCYQNGGKETYRKFCMLPSEERDIIVNYLKKAKISVVINEELLEYLGVVIAHAYPMRDFISYDKVLEDALKSYLLATHLWLRENDLGYGKNIGIDGYLTFIGHTPNETPYGYQIQGNVINIDGGAAYMNDVKNPYIFKVPLVELDTKNNKLDIISFNKDGYMAARTEITRKNKFLDIVRKK